MDKPFVPDMCSAIFLLTGNDRNPVEPCGVIGIAALPNQQSTPTLLVVPLRKNPLTQEEWEAIGVGGELIFWTKDGIAYTIGEVRLPFRALLSFSVLLPVHKDPSQNNWCVSCEEALQLHNQRRANDASK